MENTMLEIQQYKTLFDNWNKFEHEKFLTSIRMFTNKMIFYNYKKIDPIFLNQYLHLASKCNNILIAKYMIHLGATNISDALINFCKNGNIEMVRQLIEKALNCKNNVLSIACEIGNFDIIKFLIERFPLNGDWSRELKSPYNYPLNWQEGLCGACKGGNMKTVELAIYNGAVITRKAFHNACASGNIKLIYYLIDNGANDWNDGLNGACEKGHIEIIKIMIDRGANDWKNALNYVCYSNNLEAIDLISDNCVFLSNDNLRTICYTGSYELINTIINRNLLNVKLIYGLYGAIHNKSRDIKLIDLFVEKGIDDLDSLLHTACGDWSISCTNYSLQLIDYLIKKNKFNANKGLYYASIAGHIEMVDLMIKKGANNWHNACLGACSHGHFNIIELMVSKGANEWNQYLLSLCRNQYIHNVDYLKGIKLMIQKGANNWNECLLSTCGRQNWNINPEIIELLIKAGANNFNEVLIEACKHNLYNLVNTIKDRNIINWNEALLVTRNQNIIDLITNKINTSC